MKILAISCYVLLLYIPSRHSQPRDPNPLPNQFVLMFLQGTLERLILSAFVQSKMCLVLNVIVIASRYAIWCPLDYRILIVLILSDVIMLVLTLKMQVEQNLAQTNTQNLQKEVSFLQKVFLPNIYTPVILLDFVTLKPIYQNTELQLVLRDLSVELSDYFKGIIINLSQDSPTIPYLGENSKPLLDSLIQIRDELTSDIGLEFYGRFHHRVDETKLLYKINVCKGVYENKRVICIQLQDLSLSEKIKNLEETITYREHVLNTVAHDLRNPISAIIGLLDMIHKSVEELEAIENVKTCKSAGNYLINILNTYLDGSQIKKKKLRLVQSEINTKQYLEEIMKLFDLMCRQRNLVFDVKIKPQTPRVILSDKNRLTQVLSNLISNAIKFTKQGGITLHVSACRKLDSSNPTITFAVQDTGIGISPQDKENLFQVFSKIDTSSNMNPYGVGLGLVISNQLVSLLNNDDPSAHIYVESELGKGSTFSFTISSAIYCSSENPRATPSINLDELLSSDSRENSLSPHTGDVEDAIGGKMLDYSKDYGRLNGSKFHSPKNKSNAPYSFSQLFDFSSIECTKVPISSANRVNSHGRGLTLIKSAFGDTPRRTYLGTPRSDIESQERFATYLKPMTTVGSRKISSVDKISTPTNRTSRFKPGRMSEKQILIVDDELLNVKIAKYILSQKGFEVTSAANGEECVQAVKDKLKDPIFFQGILMDCYMPVMDGFETTRKLKEMMENKEIPVVPIFGLTGTEDERTILKCKEAGMTEVLEKPLNEEKLGIILSKVVVCDGKHDEREKENQLKKRAESSNKLDIKICN